jgi:LysM repeat protein
MAKTKKRIFALFLGMLIFAAHAGIVWADTYTVQPGDTFWLLSRRYGVPVENIIRANNASPSTVLYVGQVIKLPRKDDIIHTVQKGETFWILSQRYGIPLDDILKANGAKYSTTLYAGQNVIIPGAGRTRIVHTVQKGDTLYLISRQYGISLEELIKVNNISQSTTLYPGQVLLIPIKDGKSDSYSENNVKGDNDPKPSVTYIHHTVKPGEDFWNLSIKYGIPMYELLKVNNMSETDILYDGQVLKIPIHHIPVKSTPGPQYGELLDWWSEAQYVWTIGENAVLKDFYTGKTWNVRRTIGANHADVEPLTYQDTITMKSLWGNQWSWQIRPVIVLVDGRKLAASASAMPHGIQYIADNGFNGHFDVHFLNSTRHSDGLVNEEHQRAVKIAGGK